MQRREVIATLAGAAAAWPLAARAQQARVPTIGVLVAGNPPPEPFLRVLREGLREVGLTEDRNIKLEIRSADGRAGALPENAAELVALKVDVLAVSPSALIVQGSLISKDVAELAIRHRVASIAGPEVIE